MSTHRTLLVIADSEEGDRDYRQQLQQERSVEYRILSEQYKTSTLPLSESQQIDGILLGFHHPQSNSISLLRLFKEQMGDRCPPIVVVDRDDAELAVRALKHGAADYLVQDRITPEDLRLAMRSAIENAELRRELQRSQEQFQISVENMLDCFGIFSALRNESGQIVDFRVDYLNEAACENNQMPKAMQIGRGLCEIFPAHRESGLFNEYCQLVETGEPLIKDSLIYDDNFGDRRLNRVFDIRATKLNDGFVASWRDVTDRKRLELELRQTVTDLQQQQNRLQRLIDTAPIGIGIGSASGEVSVMNDTMLHLHGLTRQEFEQQGMNWRDFISLDWSAPTEQAMEQLRQQGFTPPEEKELLRRDGTRLPIWISATQWKDGTDEHVAFAIDLTAQKQAEAAIQQLNQALTNRVSELQTLLDILPVGIAIATDPDCAQMQSNAYIRQMLGIRPGDNISKSAPAAEQPPYRVFRNGEEVPADHLPMQRAAKLGVDVRDTEFDIVLPDGTVRQLLCYATPLRGEQHQIRGVIGAFLDITERNQDAAALKASQQRYRELAEAMPQMIWTADATGAVNYLNQRWYEYTALSEAESMGLAGASAIHPEERDRTLTHWSQAIANGESFEMEYRLRCWNGEYHWFICRAIPTRDHQGQITSWIGTITDIDDQKRLEARLLHEIVNHQRTEQELRRGEERLKLAQIAANAGHWEWEMETDSGFWSAEYYSLCGIDPATPLSYENWLASVLEVDRERVAQEFRSALDNNQSEISIEYRIHHPIRGLRWLITKGQTQFDTAGQPVGMIGFAFDITERKRVEDERKQAEIALEQSQERLDLAMKAAKMGSWDWDIQTGKVHWSANLEHLFGMAPGRFDGQYETVRAMIHPDDLPWVEQAIHRAHSEREDYNIEFRFIKPDGTVRWALGLGRVFYDASGIPVTMTGVDMDISERKQAEADLRASEERFRHMADNAPMMIWVTDATGYCTYLSKRWYEFTGQTEATGLGLGWLEAVHPDDRESSRRIFLNAIERQAAFQLEYRLRRQDGEYRWAIDAASPWIGQDGEFKGHIGSVIDIHDRKQAEEALRLSEERYRTLFESMDEGFCVIEMLFDQNDKPIDYRFLETNPAFERQCGLFDVQGKRMRELIPHHEDHWFEIYGSVAQTGTPIRFENRAEALQRWYDLYAFRIGQPDSRKVAVLFKDISERKRTEQELQESEARFRTLADNISQFAWMIDGSGQVIWCNQRWCDYTGTTLKEVQDWGWQKVHHPDHVDRVVKKFRHSLETGEIWEDTFPLRGKDGEYQWFLSRAIPIRDEQGRVLRWFGTNTDITELRQTQLVLQQTTERLNLALKSAPLTLFNQDLHLRYTWIHNPTHDYAMEEVIGKRDEELASPDSAVRLTELKQQVLDTGISLREEVKVTKDQQTAYYDLTIDPIRDGQNAIIGITCAAVDITERKQAELALQESEQMLRLALAGAKQGIWDWDLRSQILRWDERCKEIFGLPLESSVTYEWHLEALHPDDQQRVQEMAALALQEHTEFNEEYRTYANGTIHWILAQGCGFYDAAGEPYRMSGTVMDITERKQAEIEREQLLQREQAAREEAERANRIKDEFLAVLSHELRSPLNPILGWTKLLQTRKFDELKTAEALATIERNAKLQTQLIDDLLDVAKILRGKLSLNMTSVNLSAVIEAALETVRTAAVAKSISLHPVLPNIGQVSGDAARLQQIVWNLLSNAIKFTPNGGRVDIQLKRVGNQARIIVSDTGKGISPDFLPHIFESFQQEDASITRKYGGLGLGLAIVRQLVEAHGGTITADSPGERLGATFTVQLPLLNIEPEIKQQDELPQQGLDLTGIRVLAVDDEPDARELLTVLLSQYGAEVLTVASAAEVLANIESFQPDVLVSDIAMPKVDGYTLIQQVRALPPAKGGQIPAIALTAYAREEDYQRSINSGFEKHVTKPLEPERLVQALMTLTATQLNHSLTQNPSIDS